MPHDVSKQVPRRSKRAAALDAAEHIRKEPTGTPLAISHAGHGISELAQELADLNRLCIALANAEGPAERARDERASNSINGDGHAAACQAVNRFAAVGRRANGMVAALEQLLLGLEPKSLDETLSLTLVLAEEMEVFLSHHVDRNDCAADAERRRLGDGLRAVIRGIVHAGATSPLVGLYTGRDDLMPWAEARSTATCDASRYLVAYDQAAGRLVSTGARQ